MIFCPYERMGCETKVRRNQVESHLQSAVRLHLDLACIKLNNTEVKLNTTVVKLNVTEVKLNNTEVELNNTKVKLNDTQKKVETTTKLVEKFNTRTFIWKINNLSEILRQAKTGEKISIESAPFYTDRTESYGYKLRVKIYPNGNGPGKNTHLSVFIYAIEGEYDAILPWPFKKKVKITLIDQQEDSVERENITMQLFPGNYPASFARPSSIRDNKGRGFSLFISHEKLHSRHYLVDDTLFLQAEVGP
ncbi:hypothetical protein ACROYT_G042238 [Oculina patagonica]